METNAFTLWISGSLECTETRVPTSAGLVPRAVNRFVILEGFQARQRQEEGSYDSNRYSEVIVNSVLFKTVPQLQRRDLVQPLPECVQVQVSTMAIAANAIYIGIRTDQQPATLGQRMVVISRGD